MSAALSATRLRDVPGYQDRKNDVGFTKCDGNAGTECVVFFGGDVQDWKENMETHRDNKNYVQWSLEETGRILADKFPKARGVFVVRPSRMTLKTFSCFDNFVPCSAEGSPSHVPDFHALDHLEALLSNACDGVSFPTDLPIALIGFSKGCVVLNQIAREIKSRKSAFRIKTMIWLDGGHSGGSDTWVTEADVCQGLVDSGVKVEVHVTPYQVKNPNKPWQKKEEKIFSDTMRKLVGGDESRFKRILHFADEELSFDNHFGVLKVFS